MIRNNHFLVTAFSLVVSTMSSADGPRTVTEFARITPSDGYPMAFGAGIAVSGDDLVVGAPGYITEEGVVGTAYVFRRVGPRWVEIDKLRPSFESIDGEDFGFSVAMDGDLIVVGAPHIIAGQIGGGYGRAFIFRRDDPGTPDDPLDDRWWQDGEFRTPDEIRPGDMFGSSVAVSDGVVLIGRPGSTRTNEGSAYLYRKINGVWRHTASLNPSDSVPGDQFGIAVSLSTNVALVGARFRSDAGMWSGAAYVFRETDGAWSQEAKLTASADPPIRLFGSSVTVAGTHAVVAAPGKAYVFTHAKTRWSSETELLASDTDDLDHFGFAVATAANRVLVGAPGNDFFGAAYVFRREADEWIEERKLVSSYGPSTDILGASVAMSAKYAFAGAGGTVEQVHVYVAPSATKSLRDFALFQTCFRGDEDGLPTECAGFDLASNGRVDLSDFNEFLATLAGP